MPDNTTEAFGGYYGDELAGIVTYGPGVSMHQFLRLDATLKRSEVRELTRLWSPDGMPRNTESRLIALSMSALDEVILVVSYADPSQGHLGVVYQATNFRYLGMTSGGGTRYLRPDGSSLHAKALSIYRKRHPGRWETSKDVASELGLIAIPNPSKHRYAIAIGNKRARKRALDAQLSQLSMPYPKVDTCA